MSKDSTHRLHHAVPSWVPEEAAFHIRIRVESETPLPLTDPTIATALLRSVAFYHSSHIWFCHLFVLMPDHCHALLNFPRDASMASVVGKWKAWHRRQHRLVWQENFFDHRIRNTNEFEEKARYIRQNPVARKLCATSEAWPWWLDPNTISRWQ